MNLMLFLEMNMKEEETQMKMLIEKIRNFVEMQAKKEKHKRKVKLWIKVETKKNFYIDLINN